MFDCCVNSPTNFPYLYKISSIFLTFVADDVTVYSHHFASLKKEPILNYKINLYPEKDYSVHFSAFYCLTQSKTVKEKHIRFQFLFLSAIARKAVLL